MLFKWLVFFIIVVLSHNAFAIFEFKKGERCKVVADLIWHKADLKYYFRFNKDMNSETIVLIDSQSKFSKKDVNKKFSVEFSVVEDKMSFKIQGKVHSYELLPPYTKRPVYHLKKSFCQLPQ